MRIGVVGSFTYFENHFPERWFEDKDILALDVFEADYSWLIILHNFSPDVTLFFRPELYPRRFIESIPGIRIALLSEPVPNVVNGKLELSSETKLRMKVYQLMDWDLYHWRIFYDEGKQDSINALGYTIDEFRPLPIDTATFHPPTRSEYRYDVCFVGKATPHRIEKLDFLRSSRLSFIWVAHGASGQDLAELFRSSRIVLNVHADAKNAFEPRIYLAAACGSLVVSETLSSRPLHFAERIIEDTTQWSDSLLREYLENHQSYSPTPSFQNSLNRFSTRVLISDVLAQLNTTFN